MLQETLRELFARDLGNLEKEIGLYPTDDALWAKADGITNTGGNLALHLCGNLNHFIGAQLDNTGYIRHREKEFTDTGISRETLQKLVQGTAKTVDETLSHLEPEALENTFPLEVLGKSWTTGSFLMHLLAHLNYHLGQINYHRRLAGK